MKRIFASSRVSTCIKSLSSLPDSMLAWQVDDFHSELHLNRVPLPRIDNPKDMLIRVKAASVNPIDVRMMSGYGNTMIDLFRQFERLPTDGNCFPLTLGRDCSGEVVQVGGDVERFQVGDQVYCAVDVQRQGSHAEFVAVSSESTSFKPNVSHVKAAAFPYIASTLWNALVQTCGIRPADFAAGQVVVHGAAGGVGSLAVQLLVAWGANVVGVCSSDSLELVNSLGAFPVDHADKNAYVDIRLHNPYDLVVDLVDSHLSQRTTELLGIWRNSVHVSFLPPLLNETDRFGLPLGFFTTAIDYFARARKPAKYGRWFLYAFFSPSVEALNHIAILVNDGKIRPIIDIVIPFSKLPMAYEKVGKLHGRGKTVIDFEATDNETEVNENGSTPT